MSRDAGHLPHLGGTEAGAKAYKPESKTFALRAPSGWGDDE